MGVPEIPHSEPPSVLETHISTVVFIGERAFKFMKPVVTAFLDQSTVEKRRVACEAELRLNRRIAPDVYLGIGQVAEGDEVTDHFLVMRRLSFDRRLSGLVHTPDFADHVRAVARAVAAFHAAQPPTALAVESAGADAVAALWAGNLDELSQIEESPLDGEVLARVADLAQRYVQGRRALFADRIEHGFARDGHGDLLADDIFVLDDGPRILDCLAFDERLRCGDVLLDIAFLSMDLERLGAPDAATQLLGWYSEFTNERHPRSLADFYVAYRALVRAKINVLRSLQGADEAAGEARRFLDQCRRHLEAAMPAIVLVGGSPGTGKSTIANALGDRLGFAVLSSDEIRKDLAGIAHDAHAYAPPDQGLYTPEMSARAYTELLSRARRLVAMGETVVLDASWARAADRDHARTVAQEAGASIVELRCEVDAAVARARIVARMQTSDPSDATPEIADHLRARFEPWPESVSIDTSVDRRASVEAAVGVCRAVPPHSGA